MKVTDQKYEHLLNRYYQGKLKPEEESILYSWLEKQPDKFRVMKEARERNLLGLSSSGDTDDAWNRLDKIVSGRPKDFRNSLYQVLRIAAILLLVFGAGIMTYHVASVSETAVLYSTFETGFGERGKVILPDSSIVWMNSGSVLRFPSDFENEERRVEFTGEAYFDVSGSSKPFCVYTGDVRVSVHGTRFNLLSYPDEKLVETSLFEGSVSVGHSVDGYRSERFIKKGQRVVLDKEKLELTASELPFHTVEPDWMLDHIVFSNKSFADIARSLERKFNYRIEISDEKLKKIRYTGRFTNHEDLDEILLVISRASPVGFSFSKLNSNRIVEIAII